MRRYISVFLMFLIVLTGCKPEDAPVESRLVRTLVVDPIPIGEDRQAIGEVKPRYESDLSFRVGAEARQQVVSPRQQRNRPGDA